MKKALPKLNIAHELFAIHMKELGLRYAAEQEVIPGRKFRWDFVIWHPLRERAWFGVEIDGYFKGRHGAGWGSDNEKMRLATVNGWKFLRFSTKEVKSGSAKQFIKDYLLGLRQT